MIVKTYKNILSSCHSKPVMVVGGDEGTNHYECTLCGESCDGIPKNTKRNRLISKAVKRAFKDFTYQKTK
jgi:hypothetical protein